MKNILRSIAPDSLFHGQELELLFLAFKVCAVLILHYVIHQCCNT